MAVSKVVVIVLFAAFAVLFLLYLVGFGAPDWVHASVSTSGFFGNIRVNSKTGLWQICDDNHCTEANYRQDAMKAAQAMMCLGLIAAIGAGVCWLLWLLAVFQEKPTNGPGIFALSKKLSWILTAVAGFLGLLGVIIYGGYHLNKLEKVPNGYAFWLDVIASLGLIVLGTVTALLARN